MTKKQSNNNKLIGAIEALLFTVGRGINVNEIQEILENVKISASSKEILNALNALRERYATQRNGLKIYQIGENWFMSVKDEYVDIAKHFTYEEDLTKSVLETLATIAWKAPVLQSEVIKLRNVKAYDHIDLLEKRGFIKREKYGNTYIIKLTEKFFDYFDIDSSVDLRELFKRRLSEFEAKLKKKSEQKQIKNDKKERKDKGIEGKEEVKSEETQVKTIQEEETSTNTKNTNEVTNELQDNSEQNNENQKEDKSINRNNRDLNVSSENQGVGSGKISDSSEIEMPQQTEEANQEQIKATKENNITLKDNKEYMQRIHNEINNEKETLYKQQYPRMKAEKEEKNKEHDREKIKELEKELKKRGIEIIIDNTESTKEKQSENNKEKKKTEKLELSKEQSNKESNEEEYEKDELLKELSEELLEDEVDEEIFNKDVDFDDVIKKYADHVQENDAKEIINDAADIFNIGEEDKKESDKNKEE